MLARYVLCTTSWEIDTTASIAFFPFATCKFGWWSVAFGKWHREWDMISGLKYSVLVHSRCFIYIFILRYLDM